MHCKMHCKMDTNRKKTLMINFRPVGSLQFWTRFRVMDRTRSIFSLQMTFTRLLWLLGASTSKEHKLWHSLEAWSLGDRCAVTDEHHKPLRAANLSVNMTALEISSNLWNCILIFRGIIKKGLSQWEQPPGFVSLNCNLLSRHPAHFSVIDYWVWRNWNHLPLIVYDSRAAISISNKF